VQGVLLCDSLRLFYVVNKIKSLEDLKFAFAREMLHNRCVERNLVFTQGMLRTEYEGFNENRHATKKGFRAISTTARWAMRRTAELARNPKLDHKWAKFQPNKYGDDQDYTEQ
jgi:hypothetical protein